MLPLTPHTMEQRYQQMRADGASAEEWRRFDTELLLAILWCVAGTHDHTADAVRSLERGIETANAALAQIKLNTAPD